MISGTGAVDITARRVGADGSRPAGRRVALGLLAFALVWLTQLAATSLSPPTDNIEQLTWVRALEFGYYKHPPLPTWLLWLPVQWFGPTAWTSYVAGAACTLASASVMWWMLSQMRGPRYAQTALCAALCITYYNGRLYYYNHNVVLMLASAIAASFCWKAWTTGRLRWWAALGAALGLGGLAKYQVAVTAASVLVFWLQQRGWRDASRRQGLLLAALVALLLFLPHLQWLRANDFAPVHYALESSLAAHLDTSSRWLDSSHWLVDQLLNRALPAWLVLAAPAVAALRRSSLAPAEPAPLRTKVSPSRALLLSWGLVPLVFMPALGVLTGADLQLQWGTPFLLFAVPAAMELMPRRVRWDKVRMHHVLAAFIGVQALLLGLNYVTSPLGWHLVRDSHWRTFDSARLGRLIEQPARQALGGRICVISGPPAPAGALALVLHDRPLVLIDGRFDRSPWVSPDMVAGCGVLELMEGWADASAAPVGREFPGLSWRAYPPSAVRTAAN